MGSLGDYISGRSEEAPSRRELNRLIDRYGWFTTARRARSLLTGEADPALILPLFFWPTVPPAAVRPEVDSASLREPASEILAETPPVSGESSAAALIDRFIEHGGYRIVPSDEAPEVETGAEVDIDPEMVTTELAEIYRAQGLVAEAERIYHILATRKPQKP